MIGTMDKDAATEVDNDAERFLEALLDRVAKLMALSETPKFPGIMAAASSFVAAPFTAMPAAVSARAYLAGGIDKRVKFARLDGLDNVGVKWDQVFRCGDLEGLAGRKFHRPRAEPDMGI